MLTDAQIRNVALPENKPIDLLVGGCPSLRIVMYKGSKGNVSRTFYLKYRATNGVYKKVTLGKYPGMTLKGARAEALRLDNLRIQGTDLKKMISNERNPAVPHTLNWLIGKWREVYEKNWRENTKKDYGQVINKYIGPELGTTPLTELDRLIATDFLTQFKGKPTTGKKVVSVLRAACNHGLDLMVIQTNPFSRLGVAKSFTCGVRKRILTEDEIRGLWTANKLPQVVRSAAQVQLLTGCRAREILELKFDEIVDGCLVLSADRTKNKRGFMKPLSDVALQIIESMPRASPYVFQSTKTRKPRGFDVSVYTRLLKKSQGEGSNLWTSHDLRRTASSILSDYVDMSVVGIFLTHAPQGVTAVHYVHGRGTDKIKEAADILANHINKLLGSNVVLMTGRGR